jgi:3-isopropylmalate/(R)-2-methylmalate dehydratase large subunit
MLAAIEKNAADFGIGFFGEDSGRQGIVHVIGPELGLTQPGMTIACGDSHTSTHGAFGALAFGIGTSQVADILATQTMSLGRLKVRQIRVEGRLGPGVYAKDVILAIIHKLGVNGGVGHAYEYAGEVIGRFSMEERMTLCNMSIEGGARVGYVNPDETTFAYLKGRPYAPQGADWDKAVAYWRDQASDAGASYDDSVSLEGGGLAPFVTWGITPGQSLPVNGRIPALSDFPEPERPLVREALDYMDLREGQPIEGMPVDVVFIGSCTNGRLSDLEEAARVVRGARVAQGVKALVVPGSEEVRRQAESRGLHEQFRAAGFEWREPGCSMCLAMNPDKLKDRQVCASTSNRNFKGRQGSPAGRTLLMSPVMAAAAAVTGKVADARKVFRLA